MSFVNIPILIEGSKYNKLFNVEHSIKISDETIKRIESLGLTSIADSTIVDSENIKLRTYSEAGHMLKDLENALNKAEKDIVQKTFTSYTKEDISNAIKYLETFCFYCEQSNNITQIKSPDYATTLSEIEVHNFPGGEKFKLAEPFDKTVRKAVKELEQLAAYVDGNIGVREKLVMQKLVKRVNKHVDKILLDNLNSTEQKGCVVAINGAQQILKKFVS